MKEEIILAVVQGITEFLPVSSSGHLAIISSLISEPNLFFMIAMHLASLLAIIYFFRKDLIELARVKKKQNQIYLKHLLFGIIPAGIFGFFFSEAIEKTITQPIFIGTGFLLTTLLLFSTKISKGKRKINTLDSILIGFSQILALFPGVSRSGTTTSTGILRKVDPEKAGRFSFLIFIPLMVGATIHEIGNFYFDKTLAIAFIICFIVSLFSLNIFFKSLKKRNFWLFGFWTLAMAILSFAII